MRNGNTVVREHAFAAGPFIRLKMEIYPNSFLPRFA